MGPFTVEVAISYHPGDFSGMREQLVCKLEKIRNHNGLISAEQAWCPSEGVECHWQLSCGRKGGINVSDGAPNSLRDIGRDASPPSCRSPPITSPLSSHTSFGESSTVLKITLMKRSFQDSMFQLHATQGFPTLNIGTKWHNFAILWTHL